MRLHGLRLLRDGALIHRVSHLQQISAHLVHECTINPDRRRITDVVTQGKDLAILLIRGLLIGNLFH